MNCLLLVLEVFGKHPSMRCLCISIRKRNKGEMKVGFSTQKLESGDTFWMQF